jgi:hypothetical protein
MRNKGIKLVLLIFCLLGSSMAFAKDSNEIFKIVFSDFDVSSAGNYAYLRGPTRNMLATRLAARDRVTVLDRTFSDKELSSFKNKQAMVPGDTGTGPADFLVTGSLYALKSGLSIQVVLYPFAADKEPLRFEAVVKNPEGMIGDVEQLADAIAQSAFGYKASAKAEAAGPGMVGGTSSFATVHPEAAYKKSVHTGTVAGVSGSPVQVSTKEGKKTVTLAKEIRTMAVGDVDGDGVEEIIALSGSTLELYKAEGQKIIKVATASLPPAASCHAVNMADLDGNGSMEIYVSSTEGLNVSSFIVTWDKGKGFRIVTENIPWYIRPIFVPGKGWRLAGQKRGIEKTELVKAGIYLLNRSEQNIFSEGELLGLPAGVNLFDFVYADLDGDGAPEIVAIDKKERLEVFNRANELLWVSKKSYGGSQIYLGPSRGEAVNRNDKKNFSVDEDAFRENIFVPGRLVVTDVDNDGRQDVVINENTLSSLSIFDKIRIYNDGVIVGLSWDGTAMNESWRTGTFKGYIAGFQLSAKKHMNTSGQRGAMDAKKTTAGLYVAHLPGSGSLSSLLPGSGDTKLTIYDLEFSTGKTK